jgi:crotonobetainyl-CoA:carnitine CoA-transferase CaiB-like acyl-CoA transferase
MSSSPGPLAGVNVIDLSRVLAGPWATQLLADLGAEVIKIERPKGGDESRLFGPPFLERADGKETHASAMFLACNRGKRSVQLDLGSAAGRDALALLLADADVLVENFRVGALARMGFSVERLRTDFPRLIICSISGYGQDGPYAQRGGYDPIIQAICGLMSVNGLPGQPLKTGPSLVDVISGLYAANAIQAALLQRQRTGLGAHLDISLLDAGVAATAQQAMHLAMTGVAPPPVGNGANGGVPGGGYVCADGYVMIAPGNEQGYARFCKAIDRPDLAQDPRFVTNRDRLRHRPQLLEIIEPILAAMPSKLLVERLLAADVPAAHVNGLEAVREDPQVMARGLFRTLQSGSNEAPQVAGPIVIDGVRAMSDRPPPGLDDDGEEVLSQLGLDLAQRAAARGG